MAMLSAPSGLIVGGKRKEIYKYDAPWTIYGMNWSVRPDKRFRLALGSFVEEYNNKVIEILRHCGVFQFHTCGIYPETVFLPFRFKSSRLTRTTANLLFEPPLTILIRQPR